MTTVSPPNRPAPTCILLPPTLSSTFPDLEFSVHPCPRILLRDLPSIFPDLRPLVAPTASHSQQLLIIPTLQRSAVDLLVYGDAQAAEKDRLLARFFLWAVRVRDAVAKREPTAWLDVTDPASGAAHFGTAAACYSDVEGVVRTRKFRTVDCGNCRVAKHPRWGFAMYPATMFTTASPDTVTAALHAVNGTQPAGSE